jgi:hypothetical protein
MKLRKNQEKVREILMIYAKVLLISIQVEFLIIKAHAHIAIKIGTLLILGVLRILKQELIMVVLANF